MKSYLNLGCGERYHKDWTNIDLKMGSDIDTCNLLEGIPFADNKFDVVYRSHLLEHLPKKDALPFLKECYRVLKPLGIVRVVVPDLERIAREYLDCLEKAIKGERLQKYNYD